MSRHLASLPRLARPLRLARPSRPSRLARPSRPSRLARPSRPSRLARPSRPSRLARLALPALLVPLAIGLAACGGQAAPVGRPLSQPIVNQSPGVSVSQPTDTTGQPGDVSKTQFIGAADQICGQAEQQLAALGNPDESNAQAIADYLHQAVAIKQAEENQIAALRFPPADSALLSDLLHRSSAGLSTVNQAADQFASGDIAGGNQTLESVRSESDSVDTQLRSYGFQVCGRG